MGLDVDATWAGSATNRISYDALELRRADAAMFAGTGLDALGVRGGVIPHGLLSGNVTVSTDDVVTFEPCAVVLPGNTGDSGVYRTALPFAHSDPLQARDATYSRVDRVVARMLDTDVIGSHTQRRARFEVIPGAAASAPVAPAMPSMAVEFARLTVPPVGGGAVVVDRSYIQYACAAGGVWLVPTTARLGTSAAPGQEAFVLDVKRKVRWTGTAWRPTEPATGVVNSATTNASGSFTLTHGLGYVPSVVQVEPQNGLHKAVAAISSYGVNTCTVFVRRVSDGALVTGANLSPLTFVAHP